MENFAHVNWLAVITGTIVSFIGCWIWYSPKVFGKKWAEGSGITLTPDSKPPVVALISQLVAFLLLATVIGITATTDALITAILAILTVAVFTFAAGGFVKKSAAAMIIESTYVIIAGVVMILAQGIL